MEYGTDNDWVTIISEDSTTYPEPGQTIIFTLSSRVTWNWSKSRRERYANFPCIGRVDKLARVGANRFSNGYEVRYNIAQWMPAPDVLRDINVPPPLSPGQRYFRWVLVSLAILMPAIMIYQRTEPDPYHSRMLMYLEDSERSKRDNDKSRQRFLDTIEQNLKLSFLEYRMRDIPLEEALDVFLNLVATAEERLKIAPLVSIKFESYMKQRKDEGKERASRKV
jgi:hypothetical protein